MITVGKIISKINFEDVFVEYKKHYEEEHRSKVMDIFYKLKETKSCPNHYNMVLFITAIKENENGEDVLIEHFDCDDRTVFLMYAEKMITTKGYIQLHRQLLWLLLNHIHSLCFCIYAHIILLSQHTGSEESVWVQLLNVMPEAR